MYENEFEALTLKLDRALENIAGLVRDNDALTQERNSLRAKLQYAKGDLLSERGRLRTWRTRETISSMKTSDCSGSCVSWRADPLHIRLTRLEGNQSPVAGVGVGVGVGVGDGDNSLSMRWVKSGSYGCMIHAAGAGGGWHPTAFGSIGCVEED